MISKTIEGLADLVPGYEEIENSALLEFLDAIPGFKSVFIEEEGKLPYSINLLDELHANENTHSRILRKLLLFTEKQTNKNTFPLLELFLQYLGDPFSNIVQNEPIITAEKHRIDLQIRDAGYSIIIENKINGAGDQPQQLNRYYDKLQEDNIPEDQIHILYLSLEGGSPSEDSMPLSIRAKMGIRYREIDYRRTVYGFLKDEAIKYVATKGNSSTVKNLGAALNQYTDYLEGRFHLREGENKMSQALQQYLGEKLGVFNPKLTVKNALLLLHDKRETLSEMIVTLDEIEKTMVRDTIIKARDYLINEIASYVQNVASSGNFGDKASRVRFFPHGWKKQYCINVVFDQNFVDLFIGIENLNSTKNDGPITEPVFKEIRSVLGESEGPSNHWVYTVYLARYSEDIIEYFTNFKNIITLSKKIIEMAESPELLEILKEK